VVSRSSRAPPSILRAPEVSVVEPVNPLELWPEMAADLSWFAAKSPPERTDSAARESDVMVPVLSSVAGALGSLTWDLWC
jgi:hypothetical protein